MKQGFVKTGNMYSLYTADKHGDMVFCGAVCVRKAQLRSSQEYIENYSVMKFDVLLCTRPRARRQFSYTPYYA
jgi:hypothetical protein